MKKRYFEVVASGNSGVGRINIYGYISDFFEGVNATDFLAAFSALEQTCNRINVHINSPGGSVWEGLPIANIIKASDVDVHTYVDGIAFSMGGIIALAAPKGNVHMAKGSMLMLHSASGCVCGNAEEIRKQAEDLAKYDDTLATFVQSRLGKTLDEIKSLYFDGRDHFFTASEAKDAGLIDILEDYEAQDTPDNVRSMSLMEVVAWYQNKDSNKTGNQNMFNKFSKLSALAKVAVQDITSEMLEEVNNQIQSQGIEGVTVVTDSYLESVSTLENTVENLKGEKGNLESKVSDLEKQITNKDARIKALEDEVKALSDKPAAQPANPHKDGDDIPSGDGQEDVEDSFETEFDIEARKIFGK